MPITEISIILFAYLLGSVSSAILICRLLGIGDPRDMGSNNPGATNVLRIAGKRAGVMTLAADLLKGIIPVALAQALGLSLDWQVGVVIAAFIGHCLPLFFRFKGGKGVATGFGALLVFSWQIALVMLIVWGLLFAIFKISSIAGIGASSALPIATWYFEPTVIWPMGIMALLVLWRHQPNIKNLMSGTEAPVKASSHSRHQTDD